MQREEGGARKAQVETFVLCNFTHKALEGKLPDQELGALLVSPDLAEGDSARSKAMRSSDCSGNDSVRGLCRQLLPGRFTSSRLPRSLFGASHCGRVGDSL